MLDLVLADRRQEASEFLRRHLGELRVLKTAETYETQKEHTGCRIAEEHGSGVLGLGPARSWSPDERRTGLAMSDHSLKVLMSGGFAGAYEMLLPGFERATGIKVTTASGASQGAGPQTIGAQLARGVPADVVILSREGLNELLAADRIAVGTDVDLARVPLGIAVRANTLHPDVSTVQAFKKAMLGAKSVVVPGSTSGIWLRTNLFPRLGVAEQI